MPIAARTSIAIGTPLGVGVTMQVLKDATTIRATGPVDARLRHGLARVLADPSFDRDFVLEDVARAPGYERQFEEWCGDISGRWVGLFSSLASYTGELHPDLATIVRRIAELQRPDGRFGVDAPTDTLDYPMIWGHGRLLIGLLEHREATGDPVALEVARRLGDYYVRTRERWGSAEAREQREYMFYCQGLEGIVALFRATGEPRYLDVARTMAAGIRPEPWWHSHGYMSALRGALDLFDVTGDAALLEFVRARCADIEAAHLFPDGTPPELFPWGPRDEGCSTADWLRLQLHVGSITGQATHFDDAECALLNGLFANQTCTGSFTHHQFVFDANPHAPNPENPAMGLGTRFRLGYSGLGVDAWWCCCYHGPLGLYHAIRHTFGWDADNVYVNLPIAARATLPHPRGEVDIELAVEYAGTARYRVVVHRAPPGVHLAVRVPGWAGRHAVSRGGAAATGNVTNGFAFLPNPLRAGETVELTVPLGVRAAPWRPGIREELLWYGPYLLVPEVPGGHVCGLALPENDADGFVPLPRLRPADRPWAVEDASFAAVGIGQAVGDMLETIGRSRPQVCRLRPLSEQTAFAAPPPTAVGLPLFRVPASGRLRDEYERALRGAALVGTVVS